MSGVTEVIIISRDPEADRWVEVLRSASIVANSVASYAEALNYIERITAAQPVQGARDCIAVLDCEMPADVAFQTYKLLHAVHPMPTLLAVPPDRYRDYALDSHRSPLDEFLTKPIKPAELVLRVQAMIVRSGFQVPSWDPF